MQIDLTLRGSLTEYLPPGDGRYSRRLEVADGATIDTVLVHLGVPLELVHLVLVNGVNVPRGQLGTLALRAHDTLAVWPPLSGG